MKLQSQKHDQIDCCEAHNGRAAEQEIHGEQYVAEGNSIPRGINDLNKHDICKAQLWKIYILRI